MRQKYNESFKCPNCNKEYEKSGKCFITHTYMEGVIPTAFICEFCYNLIAIIPYNNDFESFAFGREILQLKEKEVGFIYMKEVFEKCWVKIGG